MTEPEPYSLTSVMPPPAPRHGRGRLFLSIAAIVVAVAGLGTAAVLLVRADRDKQATLAATPSPSSAGLGNPLRGAQTRCDTQQRGTRLGDNARTLIIDHAGEEDLTSYGVDVITLECLLGALSTPEWVKGQMFATRALDGRQSASWEGFAASWSYHPDSGLDIIVTLA